MKFAEASLLMPLTCIFMIGLIGLGISFFGELNEQIEKNDNADKTIYANKEAIVIRTCDRIRDGLKK